MSSRRHLLFAAGGALLVSPALALAERLLTPRQTLGPFYPRPTAAGP
jgi:protocatechuate 3,4-dioxygenase beta subunit